MRLADPTIATALSDPTISRALAVAVAGSPLSSVTLYSILRPFSPPSALNLSKTAFAACDASGKVAAPEIVLTDPTTIGSDDPDPPDPEQPARASTPAASSAAAAVMRLFM